MNESVSWPRRARRALFVLAAVLLGGSAQAEWFLLGRSEAIRFYVDQKSIARNGDYAQISQLMDFATAQWVDAQTVVGSLRMLIEYDCKNPRLRALSSEAFSEQMAEGRLLSNEKFSDPQWEDAQPGTTPDKIRQIACAKK